MICNVIFDGYYNTVSATPEFFSFIGVKNFTSLLKNTHEDDNKKIKAVFENLEYGKNYYLVVRLKHYLDNFVWSFFDIKLLEDSDDIDKKRIYVDIYTIEDLKNTVIEKNLTISEYKVLLSILGEVYFEYSFETEIIRFYWANRNQDIDIYNGKFSNWKEYMLSNKYIKEKNISIFEKLCRDIEKGVRRFSYEIRDSKIYADGGVAYNIFKGETLYYKEEPYKVVGILVADLPNTEIGIKSKRDALTGLLNKEAIVRQATEIISSKPAYSVNIVILDVDNFKAINDNFGHLFGDEIIKEIANTIDDIVKERGVIGRFGGDEFAIIFTGFNDNMELRSYLKAIRMTVERKFKNVRNKVDLSVSIGTAKYPLDGNTYEDLFKKADHCLYVAKEKGKNRYVIYDEYISNNNAENYDKKNVGRIESKEKKAYAFNNMIDILFNKGKEGFFEVIKIIGEEYLLSRIVVYHGEELKKIALWGDLKNVYDDGKYIYKGKYLSSFNSNGVFVVHSSSSIESKYPEVHSDYSNQRIYSTIQCLMYNDNKDIVGMISFEKSFQRKGWTESEVYEFTIMTHIIGKSLENMKLKKWVSNSSDED